MPDGINGIFFENQILTAKGLGAFGNSALSDGILTGCKMSSSGLNVTITEGYILICGRLVKIPQTTITFSTGTGHGGRYDAIIATVDTNAVSEEGDFAQVTISKLEGDSASVLSPLSSLRGGYDPTNEFTYDINMGGQTASAWLAICNVNGSNATVKLYNYANSMAMDLLWKNDAPTSAMTSETKTLSIPVLNYYDGILIAYRESNSNNNRETKICLYDRGSSSSFTYELISMKLGDDWYTEVRQRNVTITPSTGAVVFSAGWYKSSSSYYGTSEGSLIPTAIYGLRAGSVKY